MQKLMKRLQKAASFLRAIWASFFVCCFCVLFLGGRVYKRDGNDMREVEMI